MYGRHDSDPPSGELPESGSYHRDRGNEYGDSHYPDYAHRTGFDDDADFGVRAGYGGPADRAGPGYGDQGGYGGPGGYGDLGGYANAEHSDPGGYGSAGHSDPGYSAPGHSDPGYSNPGYGDAGYSGPGGYGNPHGYGAADYSNPDIYGARTGYDDPAGYRGGAGYPDHPDDADRGGYGGYDPAGRAERAPYDYPTDYAAAAERAWLTGATEDRGVRSGHDEQAAAGAWFDRGDQYGRDEPPRLGGQYDSDDLFGRGYPYGGGEASGQGDRYGSDELFSHGERTAGVEPSSQTAHYAESARYAESAGPAMSGAAAWPDGQTPDGREGSDRNVPTQGGSAARTGTPAESGRTHSADSHSADSRSPDSHSPDSRSPAARAAGARAAGARSAGARSAGARSAGARTPGDPGRTGVGGKRPGGAGRGAGRTRRPPALVGPLAGLLGLALLASVGAWALVDSKSACTGDDSIQLSVATAPDIAPAVAGIVKDFNAERRSVDGRCVRVTSKAADPAATATLLSGQGSAPGQTQPDIWIPDSSLWVNLVHESDTGGVTVTSTQTSVASTPIVAAMPRSQAANLAKSGAKPTWNGLLRGSGALGNSAGKGALFTPGSIRIQALDPARNAGGLAPLVITYMILQNDPDAEKVLAAVIRGLQHNVSPDTKTLFGSFKRDSRGRWPVAILPEQSVWKFNRGNPADPAVAVYPVDGTLNMNYPFTLVSKDPGKLRAAEMLRAALGTSGARETVQRLGFRAPDGKASGSFGPGSGLNAKAPQTLPAPTGKDVDRVVQAWGKLTLGTRMLALLDVSGSMGARVPGGVSRLEATARAAHKGLALYPNENEVGVWVFSTRLDGDRDFRTVIPIGPLGQRIGSTTRRQQILNSLGRLRPKPNGDTGLYDSVWAGYRQLQDGYRPDMYNILVVLTDGANDDPGSISLADLVRRIGRARDPNRPVAIVPIGVGPDIDLAAMNKIAQSTNGKAYGVSGPKDIQKVFIDVVARRACTPNCRA